MNLTDLYTFSQVAETGTVSSAALLLKLPKSTVSRRIQRLEDALGVELFHRTARTITLSAQGLQLHQRTVASLKELMAAQEELTHANAELSGPLRLTTTPGFGQSSILIDTLMNFGQRYPKVTLELSLTDRVVNLVEEGFDVGIRLFQGTIPGGANTQTRMLTNFTFGLYASPNYVTHHPVANETYDYRKHPYIGMTLLNLLDRKWINEKTQRPQRIQLATPKWTSNNFAAVKQLATRGAGLAILETFIAEPLVAQGQLVRIAPELKLNAGKAALVWPSSRHLKPSVRAFIELASLELAGAT